MSTDPKHNLPSMNELPKEVRQQLDSLVEHGLGDLNLRQILATALKALNEAERSQFLDRRDDDKANGFYERSLTLGSIPLDVEVPRARSGEFRPTLLPPPTSAAIRRRLSPCCSHYSLPAARSTPPRPH